MAFTLRHYQQETINNILENYENRINANLAVLATGLGKTVIATEFHKQFRSKEPTLFIVDRIELAYQAKESFQKSDPSLDVGIEMNVHHASEDDDVVIACVHSIGRKGSYRIGKFSPDHFNKIIVDEAHLSVSDIYVRVLNYLEVGPDNFNRDKILVGLTATPMRSDNVSLGYVYEDIPVNYDIRFGIKQGYLTDIAHLPVKTDVDISDVGTTQHDFVTHELDEAINISKRNALIVKSYMTFSKGEPCLVYCNTVDHAYAIAEMFEERGIKAKCIEANTNRKERKRAIEKFKKGDIQVLTNYGTLTLGFDAPEVSTIILGRPIRFEGLLRQVVGRGIRPSENSFINMIPNAEDRKEAIESSDKPYCKVIDIQDVHDLENIATIPSMYGLDPNFETGNEPKKFLEEVVEPLEEIRDEKQIDMSEINDIEEVEMLVEKRNLNITTLETPQEITQHSQRDWSEVGKDKYQIVYPEEKKTLIVEKNALDKWEVLEQDSKSNNAKKLNEFHDLSSAIKLGDDYADDYYDTSFAEEADWKKEGVTKAQLKYLKRFYKGRIGVSRTSIYPDTKVPKLYDRQLNEPIKNAGHASKLLSEKMGK